MPDMPDDLRYSKDHLWARLGAGARVVRVGVTDFAQQSLGDVIDVTLPRPGDTLQAGEACGDIESVKSVSDLVAPVTGTVRICIHDLTDTPTSSTPALMAGAGCSRSKPTRRRWASSSRPRWTPTPTATWRATAGHPYPGCDTRRI
jgi:glycine cleavage system H lipoate-binding protein